MKKFLLVTVIVTTLFSLFTIGASAADIAPSDLSDTEWYIDDYWITNVGDGQFSLNGYLIDDYSKVSYQLSNYYLCVGYKVKDNVFSSQSNSIVLRSKTTTSHVVLDRSHPFYLSIQGGEDATDTSLRAWLNKTKADRFYKAYEGATYNYNGLTLPRLELGLGPSKIIAFIVVDESGVYLYEWMFEPNFITDVETGITSVHNVNDNNILRSYVFNSDLNEWVLEDFQVLVKGDTPQNLYDIGNTITWSTFDITDFVAVDIKGDRTFFTRPLSSPTIVVEALQTTEILPRVTKIMGVLTIAGVSCLAFLIGLNLFGKRSLIFHR